MEYSQRFSLLPCLQSRAWNSKSAGSLVYLAQNSPQPDSLYPTPPFPPRLPPPVRAFCCLHTPKGLSLHYYHMLGGGGVRARAREVLIVKPQLPYELAEASYIHAHKCSCKHTHAESFHFAFPPNDVFIFTITPNSRHHSLHLALTEPSVAINSNRKMDLLGEKLWAFFPLM